MSKCALCGKKGLFLRVDDLGYCPSCAAAKARDMQKKAEEEARRAEQRGRFDAYVNSIPRYLINVEDGAAVKGMPYPNVKFTNITSRSNKDMLGNFVAIDTETTGLHSTQDRIIEVAAIRFRGFLPEECFQILLDPQISIPPDASAINGIYDKDVVGMPTFKSIADSLNEFIGGDNLVGHNLEFDLKFLGHGGLQYTSVNRKYYDTLDLSQAILKRGEDIDNHKLDTLCDYYHIRPAGVSHRALPDALAAGILFMDLVMERVGTVPGGAYNTLHFAR